ncbi:hypothetical protein Syun_029621 [Stephania yunnanensis]|uniref:Uncharacterized protein n=1 Tax=Stephania yunnanensis TaxID=152371 RepID=A0AAP0EAD6_9MAGN
MMEKALCCEEHAQTMEVDLLGEPILVDIGLSPVRGEALEIQTRIIQRKKKSQTTSQKKSRVPFWGIKPADSDVSCDIIAMELRYKACTPETFDQSKKIFKLNQELQSSLTEENAEKRRFKKECDKLKEESTIPKDIREMEIHKGILAHKASLDYRA